MPQHGEHFCNASRTPQETPTKKPRHKIRRCKSGHARSVGAADARFGRRGRWIIADFPHSPNSNPRGPVSSAARAIAGSSRTRSCEIAPSTSSVNWVASPSASLAPSSLRRSRNHSRRLSLKATAIFFTALSWGPSSATALTNGQPRKSFAEKRRSNESKVPRIWSSGDLSDGRALTKRRVR